MRRHDTYCSSFSCSPVTLAAGLCPGARRVMVGVIGIAELAFEPE
jgi:hypothetical protein